MTEADLGFGQRVRDLRRRQALSQRDLARRARLNQDTINRLEQLDSAETLRPSTLRKLARALRVQPAELLDT
jgi:transcriptional regulator with XRE-family HTH domain